LALPTNGRKNMTRRRFAFLILAVTASFVPSLALAQTPDPDDIAAGASLFRKKANCELCHGWAGDGRKMDSQVPDGANLRETKLNRADVITTIKCGRPQLGMPAFDKFAYSDGRCGFKKADLDKAGIALPDPPATLTAREIDNVADFLFAKVVGQGPMDHAKCVAFWGEDKDVCNELPK
jgi:hypothetical protein